MMNKESEFMKFKTNYLNDVFERLEISSNEPDWNMMILQTMKFKDFLNCKALLDMMDDDEYVKKYKFILQTKFEEMVEWFITKKLWVTSRPIPAYVSNNRKGSLLDLYLEIEKEGGHRRVTENNIWPKVAKDIDGSEKRSSRSEGGNAEQDAGHDESQVVAENPTEHYALFTDNGWNEIKRRQTRRMFDFNRARAAMDDANASVLKYSRKQNHV
ncbi:putative transcription factor & chromatin remodeling ARID family [Helianthus anomalus]